MEHTSFDRALPPAEGARVVTAAERRTAGRGAAGRKTTSGRRAGPKKSWLPIKVVDAYLLGEAVGNTLRGLTWFGGLLFAFAAITAVRSIVRDNLPLLGAVEFLGYSLPRIFLFTVPMSMLYGIVQTFSELSSRGELTALSAGGMSFDRMLRAPLAWALALAIFSFAVQESIVPWAEQGKTAVLQSQIVKSLKRQEGLTWIDQRPDNSMQRVIQADSFDPKTNTLWRPSIQIWNDQRQVSFQIQADLARWDNNKRMWLFVNPKTGSGYLANAQTGTESFTSESSETWIATDKVPEPLTFQSAGSSRAKILEKQDYEMVSLGDLLQYREQRQAALSQIRNKALRADLEKRVRSATFGIHDKIATPLVCLALVLVGAPLGVRPQRSSGGFAMGLSLAVLLVYYVVWTGATQLGKSGVAPPVFTAYVPLLVTTCIGGLLVYGKTR
jgi:lipopolysaccharide export system permease protein